MTGLVASDGVRTACFDGPRPAPPREDRMIDTPEYAFDDVHRARQVVHDQPWELSV